MHTINLSECERHAVAMALMSAAKSLADELHNLDGPAFTEAAKTRCALHAVLRRMTRDSRDDGGMLSYKLIGLCCAAISGACMAALFMAVMPCR